MKCFECLVLVTMSGYVQTLLYFFRFRQTLESEVFCPNFTDDDHACFLSIVILLLDLRFDVTKIYNFICFLRFQSGSNNFAFIALFVITR